MLGASGRDERAEWRVWLVSSLTESGGPALTAFVMALHSSILITSVQHPARPSSHTNPAPASSILHLQLNALGAPRSTPIPSRSKSLQVYQNQPWPIICFHETPIHHKIQWVPYKTNVSRRPLQTHLSVLQTITHGLKPPGLVSPSYESMSFLLIIVVPPATAKPVRTMLLIEISLLNCLAAASAACFFCCYSYPLA